MKTISALSVLLMLALSITILNAQELSGELDKDYKQLKDKSETFNMYKVIKEQTLNEFWNSVITRVNELESSRDEAMATIGALETTLVAKEALIAERDAEISNINADMTQLSYLGIPFEKDFFKYMVSIIVLALLAAMIFMVFRTRMVVGEATQKNRAFDALEQEFESYKRNALDKQLKLGRELQDHKNLLAELDRT